MNRMSFAERHALDSSMTLRFHIGDHRLGASDGDRYAAE